MHCPDCQHENDTDAEACFSCGRRFTPTTIVTRGTVIGSRYEILSQLGRGGMGVVYRAHDRVLDEDVAIKLLRPDIAHEPEMARRFRSEIKLARKVTHKNVCRIHEYNEEGALRYISMECIEGSDLRKVVRGKSIPWGEAFDLSIQIATGLQAIHEAGIVHRDLKTPNVMRDPQGNVKLMDFGIAKRSGAEQTGTATATGQVVGTPEYMSPEQVRGEQVDVRSDVYALGIIIFEIFTGEVPFRGDTPLNTIFKHLHDAPPLTGSRATKLPPSLVPVLARALAKEPAERYANAGEMVVALRTGLQETEQGVTTPGATRRRAGEDATTRSFPAAATLAATTQARVGLVSPVKVAVAALVFFSGVVGLGVVIYLILPRGGAPKAAANPPVAEQTSVAAGAPRATGMAPSAPTPTLEAVSPRAGVKTPHPARARQEEAPRPAATPAFERVPTPEPSTQTVRREPVAAPARVAEEQGFLQVMVVPGGELVLDGKSHGQVTSRKIALSVGSHMVTLHHPDYQPLQRKLTIMPGETARLVVDMAEEAIRKKR